MHKSNFLTSDIWAYGQKKKKHSDCWQLNTDLHWTQKNGKQSSNDLYCKQSNGHIWQNFPLFFSEIMKTSSLSWINMFLKIWIKTATNLMALSGKTTNSLPPIHLFYSVYSNITNSNGDALLLVVVLNPQLLSSLWPWKYFWATTCYSSIWGYFPVFQYFFPDGKISSDTKPPVALPVSSQLLLESERTCNSIMSV